MASAGTSDCSLFRLLLLLSAEDFLLVCYTYGVKTLLYFSCRDFLLSSMELISNLFPDPARICCDSLLIITLAVALSRFLELLYLISVSGYGELLGSFPPGVNRLPRLLRLLPLSLTLDELCETFEVIIIRGASLG